MYRILLTAALVLGHAAALPAQTWDATGLQLTRAELEAVLERYEQTATTTAYSTTLRKQAERDANLIRERLQDGDMRIGDRVLLAVEGHETLSDTFNVVGGRAIILPQIGRVPLEGVLRSELQDHLKQHIGRFVREPVIQVRALVRLQIMGEVVRPGFYPVPSDLLLTDVLMLAGGPTSTARIENTEIRRGDETIWERDALRQAVIDGRTLDQLSVRAGDAIYIPERSSRLTSIQNVMFMISGLASVILLVTQL